MSNNSLYFRGYDLEERKYLENYNGNSSEGLVLTWILMKKDNMLLKYPGG